MGGLEERPNRIPWPPILFFGCLFGAYLLNRILPVPFLYLGGVFALLGWLLVVAALGVIVWAFLTFSEASTPIMPHRGARRLLTGGPFRFSRNPIYLAELAILIGLGLTLEPLWYWPAAWVFHRQITRLAIEREEAHLAARFGAEWEAYAARVRRWI